MVFFFLKSNRIVELSRREFSRGELAIRRVDPLPPPNRRLRNLSGLAERHAEGMVPCERQARATPFAQAAGACNCRSHKWSCVRLHGPVPNRPQPDSGLRPVDPCSGKTVKHPAEVCWSAGFFLRFANGSCQEPSAGRLTLLNLVE